MATKTVAIKLCALCLKPIKLEDYPVSWMQDGKLKWAHQGCFYTVDRGSGLE